MNNHSYEKGTFADLIEPLNTTTQFPLSEKQRKRQDNLLNEIRRKFTVIGKSQCRYCGAAKNNHIVKANISFECEKCLKKFTTNRECNACKCEGCSLCGTLYCVECWEEYKHECVICRLFFDMGKFCHFIFCKGCVLTCEGCKRGFCSNHNNVNKVIEQCEKCGEILCNFGLKGGNSLVDTRERNDEWVTCLENHVACRLKKISTKWLRNVRFISVLNSNACIFSNGGTTAEGLGLVWTNITVDYGEKKRFALRIDKFSPNCETVADLVCIRFAKERLENVHCFDMVSQKYLLFTYLIRGHEFHIENPDFYKESEREVREKICRSFPDPSKLFGLHIHDGAVFEIEISFVDDGDSDYHYLALTHKGKVAKYEIPKRFSKQNDQKQCYVAIDLSMNGNVVTILNEKALRCWSCGEEHPNKKCARCKKAKYCSKACQKKHWKAHKKTCK